MNANELKKLFDEIDAIDMNEEEDEITEKELEKLLDELESEDEENSDAKTQNDITLDDLFGSLETDPETDEEIYYDEEGNEIRFERVGGPDIVSASPDDEFYGDDCNDSETDEVAEEDEDIYGFFDDAPYEPGGPCFMSPANFDLLEKLDCFRVISGKLFILGAAASLFDEYKAMDLHGVVFVPVTFEMLKSLGCFQEFGGQCWVADSLVKLYESWF